MKVYDVREIREVPAGAPPEAKNEENVLKANVILRDATEKALRKNAFTMVVGGDHSQGIGTIWALKKVHPNAKVVWIDAHIDINTPKSSPTGYNGGMPVAYLIGENKGAEKVLNPRKDIYYFGIRSYSTGEADMMLKHSIPNFMSEYCHETPMESILEDLNKHFDNQDKSAPLWISFCVDGLDKKEW